MTIVRHDSKWVVLFADGREPLCLESLAHRCGYRVGDMSIVMQRSERYVHEVFVRDLGMPPKQWLRHQRMAVAVQLLRSGLRPGEVAERVGFSHGNGFRKEFISVHGVRPIDYARRWMRGESVAECDCGHP